VRTDEPPQRYPTAAAINSLANRFGFPNFPDMQDWSWEVADARRLDEFISAYSGGVLNDDERFVLMEIILQSFEELPNPLDLDPRWRSVLAALDQNIALHRCTVWYWAQLDSNDAEEQFRVTLDMRAVLAKHRIQLQGP
jgi:hypothetical protein